MVRDRPIRMTNPPAIALWRRPPIYRLRHK